MFAKLKHVAICSDRFTLLGKFYESLFGMRSSKPSSDEPRGAATVGDGYVGLNINSRAPGRQSGLDHFEMMKHRVRLLLLDFLAFVFLQQHRRFRIQLHNFLLAIGAPSRRAWPWVGQLPCSCAWFDQTEEHLGKTRSFVTFVIL
jgi:hypothetical protein